MTLEEIERWAEATLLAYAETPHEVVELAMVCSAGTKEAIRYLGALGGEVTDASDVVLALASVDLSELTSRQAEALFRQIAGWASSFLGRGTPEGKLLVEAYRPHDELFDALHADDAAIARAMLSVRSYFRQVAEMAASLRVPGV